MKFKTYNEKFLFIKNIKIVSQSDEYPFQLNSQTFFWNFQKFLILLTFHNLIECETNKS